MSKVFSIIGSGVFVVMLMIVISGCGQQDGYSDEQFAQDRAELRRDIEETIDKIDTRIEELQGSMENAGDTLEAQSNETLENLRDRKDELQDKLDEMGNTTKSEWEQFKGEVNDIIDDVEGEYEDITS